MLSSAATNMLIASVLLGMFLEAVPNVLCVLHVLALAHQNQQAGNTNRL